MNPLNLSLLKTEIDSDLADLDRIVSEIKNLRQDIGSAEPSFRDRAAFGALLHSFYNGIENILKRISEEVDRGAPVGDSWHKALLKRMEIEVKGIRPAVLQQETVRCIKPYLGFRHFFRHSYTFEIDWAKLKPLVVNVDVAYQRFCSDVKSFLDSMGGDEVEKD